MYHCFLCHLIDILLITEYQSWTKTVTVFYYDDDDVTLWHIKVTPAWISTITHESERNLHEMISHHLQTWRQFMKKLWLSIWLLTVSRKPIPSSKNHHLGGIRLKVVPLLSPRLLYSLKLKISEVVSFQLAFRLSVTCQSTEYYFVAVFEYYWFLLYSVIFSENINVMTPIHKVNIRS